MSSQYHRQWAPIARSTNSEQGSGIRSGNRPSISCAIHPSAHDAGLKLIAGVIAGVQNEPRNLQLDHYIQRRLARLDTDNMSSRISEDRVRLNGTGEITQADSLIEQTSRGSFPRISSIVDACNIAAIEQLRAIACINHRNIWGRIRLEITREEQWMISRSGNWIRIPPGSMTLSNGRIICRMHQYHDWAEDLPVGQCDIAIAIQGNGASSWDDMRESLDNTCDLIATFCGGTCHDMPQVHISETIETSSGIRIDIDAA